MGNRRVMNLGPFSYTKRSNQVTNYDRDTYQSGEVSFKSNLNEVIGFIDLDTANK